jgi:hypothetical protein
LIRADKGKVVVIIENTKFQEKIMKFNLDNGLVKLDKGPTLKYQRGVKDIVKKKCNNIIDKPIQYKCIQMNPQAPILNALIKLHKETQPIRPVVN